MQSSTFLSYHANNSCFNVFLLAKLKQSETKKRMLSLVKYGNITNFVVEH